MKTKIFISLLLVSVALGQSKMTRTIKPMTGQLPNYSHPLAQNLVGCWVFNMRYGPLGAVQDLSGRGNHGVLLADAQTTLVGPFGYALTLDGVGDYVSVPDDPSLEPDKYTISIWTRLTFTSGYQFFIAKCNGNGLTDNRLHLYSSTNDLYFKGAGAAAELTELNCLVAGTWHHIVVTVNGSSGYMYVDGELVDSGAVSPTSAAGHDLRIGTRGDKYAYLGGEVDHAMMWNRDLTAAEVKQIHANPYCMFEMGTVSLPEMEAGVPSLGQLILINVF